jgi:drug/metabolite transporter (DMT)-like permease
MFQLDKTRGAFALLGAAFLYASFGVLIREMSKAFGDSAQAAVRFALAAVFLVAINVLMRKRLRVPRHHLFRIVAYSVSFTLTALLFTFAVTTTTLANSVFLLYAGSLCASFVLGTLFFKEHVTMSKVAALVVALLGLGMYSGPLTALSLGVLAALVSGLLDGITNGLRKSLQGIDRNTVLMYQNACGALLALVVTLFVPEPAIRHLSVEPLLATLLFAVLILFLGNLLLYGFQHFDVNVGAVILATELFFATIFGYVFFHEAPAPHEIAGGLLIFIASIMTVVERRHLRRILRWGREDELA